MRHRICRLQFNRAQVGRLGILGAAQILQQVGEMDPVETLARFQIHSRLKMFQGRLGVVSRLVLEHAQKMMGSGILRIGREDGVVQFPRLRELAGLVDPYGLLQGVGRLHGIAASVRVVWSASRMNRARVPARGYRRAAGAPDRECP